jgi:Regulator of ribonuclease activity B
VAELRTLGWPSAGMTEEWPGCAFWRVYAHERRGLLSEAGIADLRREMEALAKRYGGAFDGWEVGSGGDLRYARPGEVSE